MSQCSVYAFFYGVEAEVVDDFIAGATEEVGRELCTGKAHGKVADGEHKHFGAFCCGLGGKAEFFEVGGGAFVGQRVGAVFMAAAAVAFAACSLDFVGGFLVDVGILVCAEEYLFAACNVGVAFGARLIYSLLYLALAHAGEESAFLFCFEEELPSLFGYRHGKFLYIVAAAGRVYNLVEVALFLKEELLVAGYTLRESVGCLIRSIERSCHNRVYTAYTGRECFGLAAEQIHVCVIDSLVEARCRSVNHHLGGSFRSSVLLYDLSPEHTCGAEFGNLHEEVARYAHIEFYAHGHFVGAAAGFGKEGHPLSTPSESVA